VLVHGVRIRRSVTRNDGLTGHPLSPDDLSAISLRIASSPRYWVLGGGPRLLLSLLSTLALSAAVVCLIDITVGFDSVAARQSVVAY